MFKTKHQYRFSILRFQPRLSFGSETVPVGVIVEDAESKILFIVGRYLSDREKRQISDVGRQLVDNIPDLIVNEVKEAVQSDCSDVLGFLASANRWNLFLSEPESVKKPCTIDDLAFSLFRELVLKRPEVEPVEARREEFFSESLPLSSEQHLARV